MSCNKCNTKDFTHEVHKFVTHTSRVISNYSRPFYTTSIEKELVTKACDNCVQLLKSEDKDLIFERVVEEKPKPETKICAYCNIERPMHCYNKNKLSSDGFTHKCKKCISDSRKESQTKTKKTIKIKKGSNIKIK